MGKSSGSTRASSATSPKGLGSGFPQEVIEAAAGELRSSINAREATEAENAKIRKAIDKKGFTSSLRGQWDLETSYGGAMILDETDFKGEMFGYKEYGVSAWDKDFNMIEDGQERNAKRFPTLNEAKRYAKELIKSKYQ